LKELRGAQALAVLEHRTGTVWLARDDNRPLYVCRLRDDRRYVFASTLPILVRSVEERLGKASHWISDMIPLAPGYVHTLTPDLRFVVRSTKPTFTEFEESLE
jgi:asparagine synthetase B (glutamine-hydrolysing)